MKMKLQMKKSILDQAKIEAKKRGVSVNSQLLTWIKEGKIGVKKD